MQFPLTYEEYEKKIFEKFSEPSPKYSSEKRIKILKSFLEDEGKNYINTTFKETKDRFSKNIDNWKEYSLSDEEIIDRLISYPIDTLKMLLL